MNYSEYKKNINSLSTTYLENLYSGLEVYRPFFQANSNGFEDIMKVYQFWYGENDVISIQTSGSTGKPKKINLRKENIFNSAIKSIKYFKINQSSEILHVLPANKIGGLMLIIRAIISGAKIHFYSPSLDPMFQIPDEKSFDFCSFAPSQVLSIIKNDASEKKLKKIKNIVLGGSPIYPELERYIETVSNNYYLSYGMTETISHVAIQKLNGKGHSKYFEPLEGIKLTTNEEDRLVIHAPDIISEPIVTNDLASLEENGKFKWLGRFDHIVNSGGIKLIPEIIENKIRHLIPYPFYLTSEDDAVLGQKLVMIILKPENEKVLLTFETEIKEVLGKYEMPREIYVKSSFAYTKNKKLIRLSPDQLTD